MSRYGFYPVEILFDQDSTLTFFALNHIHQP